MIAIARTVTVKLVRYHYRADLSANERIPRDLADAGDLAGRWAAFSSDGLPTNPGGGSAPFVVPLALVFLQPECAVNVERRVCPDKLGPYQELGYDVAATLFAEQRDRLRWDPSPLQARIPVFHGQVHGRGAVRDVESIQVAPAPPHRTVHVDMLAAVLHAWRHRRASPSIPRRKSPGSTATKIRIWGVIWITPRASRALRPTPPQSPDCAQPAES
jgi:hypothetical protein